MCILVEMSLPVEIATKIINMTQNYIKCASPRCDTMLCERRRVYEGKCSNCLWFEIG
jgi:hypothetical protein